MKSIIRYLIAGVWLINGLCCKVLDLAPRHEKIVAAILGPGNAPTLTLLIGIAEIGMAAWIVSGLLPRINAVAQILIIAVMNMLEALLAPELLLFGRGNAFFALMLIGVIYFNEFKKGSAKTNKPAHG